MSKTTIKYAVLVKATADEAEELGLKVGEEYAIGYFSSRVEADKHGTQAGREYRVTPFKTVVPQSRPRQEFRIN